MLLKYFSASGSPRAQAVPERVAAACNHIIGHSRYQWQKRTAGIKQQSEKFNFRQKRFCSFSIPHLPTTAASIKTSTHRRIPDAFAFRPISCDRYTVSLYVGYHVSARFKSGRWKTKTDPSDHSQRRRDPFFPRKHSQQIQRKHHQNRFMKQRRNTNPDHEQPYCLRSTNRIPYSAAKVPDNNAPS